MQDALAEENVIVNGGPKSIIRTAGEYKWIDDPELWQTMQEDRNLTTHTYDGAYSEEVVKRMTTIYFKLFHVLNNYLKEEKYKSLE